ncbi:MAG: malate synthase A [Thermoanaerobaculia bacterium]
MTIAVHPDLEVRGRVGAEEEHILSEEALRFVARLHRELEPRRRELLDRRVARDRELAAGAELGFPEETRATREREWRVAETPPDLERRFVEITGPADRKMMINALNSGADVFMADLEDALSPTWGNILRGQVNLYDAVRRQLGFRDPEKGKDYRLDERIATLMLRPRGWHLREHHVTVDAEPVSASLVDFGLYFFHNARELLERGSGPYLYLPKLESHLEARLWNDAFLLAQESLGVPRGSVRATVLVETLAAVFEMDEILWELQEHAAGLNAGRWDYIFSVIRLLRSRDLVLPDRSAITMTVPFMRAYTELLVRVCHRRGAHAIGGMAAFIPSRKDPEVNERALSEVRYDKEREATDGFDGSWVAHPDLVPLVAEVFDDHLESAPHQKQRLRDDVAVSAGDLLDFRMPGAGVTEAGLRTNLRVALQYLDSWLSGWGAAAIDNKMEDTATAEISRAQLWQWRTRGARLEDGRTVDEGLYREVREGEVDALREQPSPGFLEPAAELLDELVLAEEMVPFLTGPGYERLLSLEDGEQAGGAG